MGFATDAVHAGQPTVPRQVGTSVPIHQTVTWRFDDTDHYAAVVAGKEDGYLYTRGFGNPTIEALERRMAALERTDSACAFASGTAALDALLSVSTSAGDRVVVHPDVYAGSRALLRRAGLEVVEVAPRCHDELAVALVGASLMLVEAIANASAAVADLPMIGRACAAANVPLAVDGTLATPALCRPREHGATWVLHSTSKYLSGHGDTIGGIICTDADRVAALRDEATLRGAVLAPFDAWLTLRGLATLQLRMRHSSESAESVAGLLSRHPAVAWVRHAGLAHDSSYAVARRTLRGCGGPLVVAELAGGLEAGRVFCRNLEVAWLAGSIGGAQTLVAHPASTVLRDASPSVRAAAGVSDGLVKIGLGLEDPVDVLGDLRTALDACLPTAASA